jgi:hypothetical protein
LNRLQMMINSLQCSCVHGKSANTLVPLEDFEGI